MYKRQVFIPVQLFVMGWFGGLGPFKGMKDVRMGKHPGNAPEYDFDKISALENSPLAGKQVCILGSSVVYGSASGENAVGEYLSARLGFDLTKEAVSGTTLVDIGEKSVSYTHLDVYKRQGYCRLYNQLLCRF